MDFLSSEASDELEALFAIYGESVTMAAPEVAEAADGSSSAAAVVVYKEDAFTARFALPAAYPEAGVPALALQLSSRDDLLSQRAQESARSLLSAELGMVSLYPAIELLRMAIADGKAGKAGKAESPHRLHVNSEEGSEASTTPPDLVEESERIDFSGCPPVHRSEPIVDRGSTFIGHCARVSSMDEVAAFRRAVTSDRKVCCMRSAFFIWTLP